MAGGVAATCTLALLLAAASPAAASTGRALTLDSTSPPPPSPAPASRVTVDADRLLAFRGTLDNGDAVLSDWKGDNPCGWTGITCDASGVVVKINLMNRGLEGQFAPWPLPAALQELLLSYNKIRGAIPTTMLDPASGSPTPFQLPPGLTRLALDHNLLSGSIIPLQLPATLTRLSLEGNQLEGALPVGWSLPAELRALYLGKNRITGTIPSNFYLPGKLEILDLSKNALYGELPNSWSLQPSLALLYLNDNDLQGTLPSYTSAPNAIIYIYPGNPKLCGPVPDVPRYYSDIDSSRNQLASDALPACPSASSPPASSPSPQTKTTPAARDQATLDLLQRLRASFTNAVGPNMALDDWFKQLWRSVPERASNPCDWTGIECNKDASGVEYIQYLELWDVSPDLEGEMPKDGWELPGALEQFRIDGNKITGSLPSSWKLPDTLTTISLNSNLLTGTIPSQPLGNAGMVYLQNNKLSGPLPTFTTRCPYYVIQPGNDDLCGEVPKCPKYVREGLQELTPLKLCSNLPPASPAASPAPSSLDVQLLLNIKKDFSNGEAKLPGWKADTPPPCQKNSGWAGVVCREDGTIKTLGLMGLGLEGSIPTPGWELPGQLEVLDLSSNSLSGRLPTAWPSMPAKLSVIYLEGNKFSGPLAYWPSAANVKVGIFPGNSDLCGKAPDSPEYYELMSATRVFALSKSCPNEPIHVQDTLTLLALKTAFENGGEVLSSWVGSPGSPCNWDGVRCNSDGKVDDISLTGKGLKATLSPTGLPLPDTLVYLSLANNDIGGSLSSQWALPGSLEFLDLSGCKLSGTIPPSWESVLPKHLSQVFLYGNQLSGSVPSWPSREGLMVYVKPNNDGLCGSVPSAPKYMDFKASLKEDPVPLASLKTC